MDRSSIQVIRLPVALLNTRAGHLTDWDVPQTIGELWIEGERLDPTLLPRPIEQFHVNALRALAMRTGDLDSYTGRVVYFGTATFASRRNAVLRVECRVMRIDPSQDHYVLGQEDATSYQLVDETHMTELRAVEYWTCQSDECRYRCPCEGWRRACNAAFAP